MLVADRYTSISKSRGGQWLSNDVVTNLPSVRRAFDLNRDPLLEAQLRDNKKTESERRREQMNRNRQNKQQKHSRSSKMVTQDHPHPAPRPDGPIADAADRKAFRDRWLAEQRDATFEQAADLRQQTSLKHEMTLAASPSRSLSHGPEG